MLIALKISVTLSLQLRFHTKNCGEALDMNKFYLTQLECRIQI